VPIISVDPKKAAAPVPPDGTHEAVLVRVTTERRDEDATFNAGDMEAHFLFRWDDPDLDPAVNGSLHTERLNMEEGKSRKFVRWAQVLKQDPEQFDTDEVRGMRVKATNKNQWRQDRDGEPGEKIAWPRIQQIMPLD
jgi:hypothetical protein